MMQTFRTAGVLALLAVSGVSQVYSPVVLRENQPDPTNLKSLAEGIYRQANAQTPREKAEAIWRFFLTDGRFVKPGFWYHIAGWSYEEPLGEVLDPVKLLNSYGFGLCYHIAPLLAAVWEAGGFEDARVWFLTGHTVAEVFYDGAYHYFDSDMMGYNPLGDGPLKQRPVASVHQIELDGKIITGKLAGPKRADVANVDYPWYPADVRENAIDDLAALFTSTQDNWLYAFRRYPSGHHMDFSLRPGERMIRFYRPEAGDAYYLPYRFDGHSYREFPQEIAEYQIRTGDGPQSQKDSRRWSTGRMEYRPPNPRGSSATFSMPCPYVIIDAHFSMTADLRSPDDSLSVETSTDGGHTWSLAGALKGIHEGAWEIAPAVLSRSAHGRLTAVSGVYGYLVRFSGTGAVIRDIVLATRFQLNPRTLPELSPGNNAMLYRAASEIRTELPVRLGQLALFASKVENLQYEDANGQGYLKNGAAGPGSAIFELTEADGTGISSFDAGGRFLDLRAGLAPDKLTAEVRKVEPWPSAAASSPHASIGWAIRAEGPYQTLWEYNPQRNWKDGQAIDRVLLWPEVDRHVSQVPPGCRRIYVRYEVQGMAMDDVRLALTRSASGSSPLVITHEWLENGTKKTRTQRVSSKATEARYNIDIPDGVSVSPEALVMEIPPSSARPVHSQP